MNVKRGSRLAASLATLLAVFTASVTDVGAQDSRRLVEEGNALYEEGKFAEAHERYLEALAASPSSSLINFNDGNALYSGSDYDRALEAYRAAIMAGDGGVVAPAWYNVGNAFFRQQKLQESLDAYKEALRLDPSDLDAKHNLERVLELMRENQEQQDQQGEDQGEDPPPDEEGPQEQRENGSSGEDEEETPADRQDQGNQDDPRDSGDQSPDATPREPETNEDGPGAQPKKLPGEFTPEEAQRLLGAIEEDPQEVDRKPPPARGRKPRKPW